MKSSDQLQSGQRKYARWYFYDRENESNVECEGLSAEFYVRGLLFKKSLGSVIIRDIGPGGAGIVAPKIANIKKNCMLALSLGTSTLELDCCVRNCRPFIGELSFYGLEWSQQLKLEEMTLIAKQWKSFFIDESLTNFLPPDHAQK